MSDIGSLRMSVVPAAVTAWPDREPRDLVKGLAAGEHPSRLPETAPIWVDLDVRADAELWLEPWTPLEYAVIDWSPVRETASALGLSLPEDDAGGTSTVARALQRLPMLNELAALRWLDSELAGHDGTLAMPLAGLIPASTLKRKDHDPDPLDGKVGFVLLRVNLIVIDRWVLTARLPDRLCVGTGVSECSSRRVPADERLPRPDLTAFSHYLPPVAEPRAIDIGRALALYLCATCGSAAEAGRDRLFAIERRVLELPASPLAAGDLEDVSSLDELGDDVFRTRGALASAEEEVVRVAQRLAEVEREDDEFLVATRARYQQGLEGLRRVQRELRLTGTELSRRVDTWHLQMAERHRKEVEALQRKTEQRETRLQAIVGVIGTMLIVPGLVATMFDDSVKLPDPQRFVGMLGMLLTMLGAAALGWALLSGVTSRDERNGRSWVGLRAARTPAAVAALAFPLGLALSLLG